MPRVARIVIPGVIHHVVQRGNFKQQTFYSDEDFEFFLNRLRFYAERACLQIAAYCLMPNHTHLGVIPQDKTSLVRTFKPLHLVYSQYLNRKFSRSGVNWQGRYFSAPLDDLYRWRVFQYIALNPVEAKIVERAEEYQWSSAAAHLNVREDQFLTAEPTVLEIAKLASQEIENWRENAKMLEMFQIIRACETRNLPLGNDIFLNNLERIFGRSFRIRSKGRPKILFAK